MYCKSETLFVAFSSKKDDGAKVVAQQNDAGRCSDSMGQEKKAILFTTSPGQSFFNVNQQGVFRSFRGHHHFWQEMTQGERMVAGRTGGWTMKCSGW